MYLKEREPLGRRKQSTSQVIIGSWSDSFGWNAGSKRCRRRRWAAPKRHLQRMFAEVDEPNCKSNGLESVQDRQ